MERKTSKAWIGVDLDGTLAYYSGWKGPDHIGPPIPAMMDRVKAWLADGKTVKIFTARASIPEQILPVTKWLVATGLPELEVVCTKDLHMIDLWDDRCTTVEINTGRPMAESHGGIAGIKATGNGRELNVHESVCARAFLNDVHKEMARATAKFGPIHTAHELLGILEEEWVEAKEEIFHNGETQALREELMQVAAMCVRGVIDLDLYQPKEGE